MIHYWVYNVRGKMVKYSVDKLKITHLTDENSTEKLEKGLLISKNIQLQQYFSTHEEYIFSKDNISYIYQIIELWIKKQQLLVMDYKKLQRKVCDEEGLRLSGRQPSQHMGLGLNQSRWPGQGLISLSSSIYLYTVKNNFKINQEYLILMIYILISYDLFNFKGWELSDNSNLT